MRAGVLTPRSGVVPSLSLASGLLAGTYAEDERFPEDTRLGTNPYFAGMATDERFEQVDELRRLAEDSGRNVIEMVMLWLAAQQGISSILVGATKIEQINANAHAVNWESSADDLVSVAAALSGR